MYLHMYNVEYVSHTHTHTCTHSHTHMYIHMYTHMYTHTHTHVHTHTHTHTCTHVHTHTCTHSHTHVHTHVHTHTHRARWIKVAGVLYKSPCAVLLKLENDYPQYGQVIEILVVNSFCVMFNVCVMTTVSFLSHFNAYFVSPSPVHRVIPLSKLHSPFPVHIYHVVCSGVTKQVAVPKFHISGCLY